MIEFQKVELAFCAVAEFPLDFHSPDETFINFVVINNSWTPVICKDYVFVPMQERTPAQIKHLLTQAVGLCKILNIKHDMNNFIAPFRDNECGFAIINILTKNLQETE